MAESPDRPSGKRDHGSGSAAVPGTLAPDPVLVPTVTYHPQPLTAGAGEPATTDLQIPGYEIVRELGRGGMGVVFLGRQVNLQRLVAIKIVRSADAAGPEELARFRAEAAVIARLRHPNIVQVYEFGEWSPPGVKQSLPFFALEYVEGGSLAGFLKAMPQPPQAAARVVETLARAMWAAHDAGIVHRDLKPANILLERLCHPDTEATKQPPQAHQTTPSVSTSALGSSDLACDFTPKITDFGLARRLDAASLHTHTGAVLGTPSYMAPEQARGLGKTAGPAADIYALGAILYECLTGRPPFRGTTVLDTLQQVYAREPVAPRQLQPTIPRDLETICLKCLRKEAEKRYGTAGELAEDLQRFREGRPIQARPVGVLERSWRWCRRNRVVAVLATVLVLFLLGLSVGGPLVAVREFNLATAEKSARLDAEQKTREARAAERRARFNLYVGEMTRAREFYRNGAYGPLRAVLAAQDPAPGEEDLRGFEWYYLQRECHLDRGTLAVVGPDEETLYQLADLRFSADGKTLHAAAQHQWPRLAGVFNWDIATGATRRLRLGGQKAITAPLALSPDGKLLVSSGLTGPARIKLWDAQSGAERATLGDDSFDSFDALAISPDGRTLAAGSSARRGGGWKRQFVLVDLATGQFRQPLPEPPRGDTFGAIIFSPDGKSVAFVSAVSGESSRDVHLLDVATGKELAELRYPAGPLAFSPDSRLLAAGTTWDQATANIRFWDAATGKEVGTIQAGSAPHSLAFSPDGALVAAGLADATIKLWDVASNAERGVKKGHSGSVHALAFSPDGKLLASGSGTEVKLWDVSPQLQPFAPANYHRVESVALSPDSKLLATGATDLSRPGQPGEVRLWDTATGQERAAFRDFNLPVNAVAFSPDGNLLAAGGGRWRPPSDHGEVKLWDLKKNQAVFTVADTPGIVSGVTFAPDGNAFVTSGGWARLWDLRTQKEQHVLASPRGCWAWMSRFTPDGKLLATVGGDWNAHTGFLTLWDPNTGKEDKSFYDFKDMVYALDISRDGNLIAAGSFDDLVRIWDRSADRWLSLFRVGTAGGITDLAFTPDGKGVMVVGLSGRASEWRLDGQTNWAFANLDLSDHLGHSIGVAFNREGTLAATGGGRWQLWRLPGWREAASLGGGHRGSIMAAAYAPDGQTIATGGSDGAIGLWTNTGAELAVLGRRDRVGWDRALAFSPDGRMLVADDGWGGVNLWDVPGRRLQARLHEPGRNEKIAAMGFSPDGRTVAALRTGTGAKPLCWDVATGQPVSADDRHLSFLPAGRLLLPARKEQDATGPRLLLLGDGGKVRATFAGAAFVAITHDGKKIATAGGPPYDWGVKVWDVDSGAEIGTPLEAGTPLSLAFRTAGAALSPDGRTLAVPVLGTPLSTSLVDTSTGRERYVLEGLAAPVAFSPDGNVLFGGGGLVGGGFPKLCRAATPAQVVAWEREAAEIREMSKSRPKGPISRLVCDNSNDLIRQHRQALKVTASHGTEADWAKLTDGRIDTGWWPFWRMPPDQKPNAWYEISFPEDVTVHRITVLGSGTSESGLAKARLELRSADDGLLVSMERPSEGEYRDIDFRLDRAHSGVRTVRIVFGRDDIAVKSVETVGIAEVLAE